MSGVHEYGTRDQTDAVVMEGFNVFETEEGMCIMSVTSSLFISLTFTGLCTILTLAQTDRNHIKRAGSYTSFWPCCSTVPCKW